MGFGLAVLELLINSVKWA